MHVPRRYIVMLGSAGAGIALTLAELHREEVQKRFPKHFLKSEKELYNIKDRMSLLLPPQESFVMLQENEVFPALWELADSLNAGLDVALGKIPISQFVVEVCELFDANPYVNMTALENSKCFHGSVVHPQPSFGWLIATDKPEELLAVAEEKEIPAAVIGQLTDKNDRIVRNGEIIRYLTPEG